VISAFHDKVKACGHVTSGDIIPLGKAARELARSDGQWSKIQQGGNAQIAEMTFKNMS